MPRPILFDFFRLFLGPAKATPRGVDRVDLGYARFIFENWPGDCIATLATPWGVRWFDRQRAVLGLNKLEELWAETIRAEQDDALDELKRQLAGASRRRSSKSGGRRLQRSRPVVGFFKLLAETGFTFGDSVVRSAPLNGIYLNIGQLGWAMPWLTSWLGSRPDCKAVFMVHDVIPLDEPDLVWRAGPWLHTRVMSAVAKHAAGIIVPTQAASRSVMKRLRDKGRSDIAIKALPHPVADVFLQKEPPDPELLSKNYFVVCGAIEPRKNHRVLFEVWEQLVQQRGDNAPQLVVAGSPGRGARPILEMLAQSPSLRSRVMFAPGLSSPALRRVIANAKALLMPSLAEGFGLPIIEGLATGTPVIASSLAAHQEIAGDFAVYCDPNNPDAWLKEISRFSDGDAAVSEIRQRISTYQPLTTREYFKQVEDFLDGV